MAKRVNQQKRRIRILILASGCLLVLMVCGLLISSLVRSLSPEKEEPKQEQKQEEKQLATVVAKTKKEYKKYKVDESGNIPVMMYHGIRSDVKSKDTGYTGGNVDQDGYTRTADAFKKDLEMYYKEGYQMVRLDDYVDGKIDVDAGKSPIVLTFDDGNANNIRVTGTDKNGDLKIDPKSAVGILESFKEKYPDFHVTATFFVNASKFNQPKYDDKIIKWLVKHGYDVGNHTMTHPDLTETTKKETEEEVGYVYNMLEEVIPKKYVHIVALPFGTPYSLKHENMDAVFDGTFDGKKYHTKTALQVAWEADYSPFNKEFNPTFLKRIRAYDNNGEYFDIEYSFNTLSVNRYISDGDINTIVIPKDKKDLIKKKYKKKVITYE